jgi:antitoxin VapB
VPLEPKSEKTNVLARELATVTGEDVETAVERAIEERLARLPQGPRSRRGADIDAIFERLARMPVVDHRTHEEIFGYDNKGLPT